MGNPTFATVGKSRRTARKKNDPKEQFEETLQNLPATVDHSACWTAYQLDSAHCPLHIPPNPITKNCRLNPYCIYRLGEEKWGKLQKKQTETSAPSVSRRDIENQPCGLHNSANYCYVNSFLQTWFNDLPFRQAIYDWRPSPDFKAPEGSKMDIQAVMNALQKLFITMEKTPYDHTDALELISLLKLDNEQHDVQEFFMVFFEAICRHLETHPNGVAIRQAILSRVRGKTRQTISCTCGKEKVTDEEFRSVNLHINNGANSLSQLLDAFWCPGEEMSDYTCDQCGTRGNTTRKTECCETPPVLVLHLVRYQYDFATGRRKKLATAIQYPREFYESAILADADPDSVYELAAVMIHEGQNVNCGHYYDLIKDSKTGNWFSFNDKEVTPCKPVPGVAAEKAQIGRSSSDMRNWYVLIYKKAEPKATNHDESAESVAESVSETPELRPPPPEIVQEIQRNLDAMFQEETDGNNLSYQVWTDCLTTRQTALEHLWTHLDIEDGSKMRRNPDLIAFLPTALLVEIQRKEYSAVSQMRDLNSVLGGDGVVNSGKTACDDDQYMPEATERAGEQNPEETEDEYIQRLNDIVAQIREEKQLSLRLASERLQSKGKFDSTNPPDVETLKLLYVIEPLEEIEMPLCPHGKVPLEDIQRGTIKAVSLTAAEKLLRSYNLGLQLITDAYQNDEEDTRDLMGTTSLKTGSDLCQECVDLARKEVQFRNQLSERIQLVDEIKARATKKGKAGYEFPPNDAFWVSKTQLTSYRKLATDEMKYQKSLAAQAHTSILFSTKHDGFIKAGSEPPPQNGDAFSGLDSALELPPHKRRRIDSDDEMDGAPSKTPSSSEPAQQNGVHPEEKESSPEIEVIGEKLNDPKEVFFNDDLICPHGELDCVKKRVWLHKHEWNTLVVGHFQKYRAFPVTTRECHECSLQLDVNQTRIEDCQAKLQQIQTLVSPILRKIEKRALSPDKWEGCTHVLCPKFIYKFRAALKSKAPMFPQICQECLLCAKHTQPFLSVANHVTGQKELLLMDEAASGVSDSVSLAAARITPQSNVTDFFFYGPLPITAEEWDKIVSAFRDACGENFTEPREIEMQEGSFDKFCNDCFADFNHSLLRRRCDYPNGATIYVRLKADEPDDAEAGTSRSRAPTTRRLKQKGLIDVRICSTDTIKDLKKKLYSRTNQSPVDQLLYMGDNVLEDHLTLSEAGVSANNQDEPLLLITQQPTQIIDEPRVIERGFRDTALAT